MNHRIAGFWCLRQARAALSTDWALAVDVGGPAQGEVDHARRRRLVGEAVDQDEGAGLPVVAIGVEGDRHGWWRR